MHTVFALLCFVVVIHWRIFPYPSGLLHWHCGNLTIAPVPAKQPWWIWINTSCEFIMNDCITTTKQSTTKLCAYFLGYTVHCQLFMYTNRWSSYGDAVCMWKAYSSILFYCISNHIASRIFFNIGSGNGLFPILCQANIWTNSDLLLTGANFGEIWIKTFTEDVFQNLVCKMTAILFRPQ